MVYVAHKIAAYEEFFKSFTCEVKLEYIWAAFKVVLK